MKKMNQWLTTAVAAMAICFGAGNLLAQSNGNSNNSNSNNNGNNNNNNNGGGRRGRGNFDPSQFRQQMMDNLKEKLDITDDAEWKAIEPMIQKVFDLRRETFPGRGGFGRGRGGGDNGPSDSNRGGGGPAANPEMEALQKAIDGKASNAEMKAAITKYQEWRKAKMADLEKAQADLRKVLSVRQEAVATMYGLL